LYNNNGNYFTEDNTEKEEREKIPVFYNLYTKSVEDIPRVQKLMEQQLITLGPSHTKVYVRSVGAPINITKVSTLGGDSIEVQVLRHDDEGWEFEALGLLWDYCREHDSEKVIYLHSKGSFHTTLQNEKLRQVLTEGATSDECRNLPSTCNICSSRMSPIPHVHTSGNMWLARCDYIVKLKNPRLFENAMDSIYDDVKDTYLIKNDINNLGKKLHPSCLGQGRFAAEHWVHSHPDVMPCDLSPSKAYIWGYSNIPRISEWLQELDLKAAPRFPLESYLNKHAEGCANNFTDALVYKRRLIHEYQQLYDYEEHQISPSWFGWNLYAE